tara:strand:- start:2427 stop:2603 length:177 start_codon:yes stop_codon:yes gene_type:complete
MNAFIKNIEEQLAALKENSAKLEKGNKAAGTRARVAAMQITKDCKAYRNAVTEFKNNL